MPLDEPVTGGEALQLDLGLSLPSDLGLSAGPLSEAAEARVVQALEDGAVLRARR